MSVHQVGCKPESAGFVMKYKPDIAFPGDKMFLEICAIVVVGHTIYCMAQDHDAIFFEPKRRELKIKEDAVIFRYHP